MTIRIKGGTAQGPGLTRTPAHDDLALRPLIHKALTPTAAVFRHPKPEEVRAHVQEHEQPIMSAVDVRLMRQLLHHASQTVADQYGHLSPKVRTHPEEPGSTGAAAVRESFRLFRPSGSDHYRMTFCISGVRYDGSTLCKDHGHAVMVARVVYAEIKETAGRLRDDDIRRRDRTVSHVRGWWLTSRPKRLPSLAGTARVRTN